MTIGVNIPLVLAALLGGVASPVSGAQTSARTSS